jgi:poly(A) polymerase
MQPRFENRSGNRAYRLLEAPRFRMAYDFLALRAASGEMPAELEAWWRGFQSADPEARKAMLLPETGPRKRRRRPPQEAACGSVSRRPKLRDPLPTSVLARISTTRAGKC